MSDSDENDSSEPESDQDDEGLDVVQNILLQMTCACLKYQRLLWMRCKSFLQMSKKQMLEDGYDDEEAIEAAWDARKFLVKNTNIY